MGEVQRSNFPVFQRGNISDKYIAQNATLVGTINPSSKFVKIDNPLSIKGYIIHSSQFRKVYGVPFHLRNKTEQLQLNVMTSNEKTIGFIFGALSEKNGRRSFYVDNMENYTRSEPIGRETGRIRRLVEEMIAVSVQSGAIDAWISSVPFPLFHRWEFSRNTRKMYKNLEATQDERGIQVRRNWRRQYVITRREV